MVQQIRGFINKTVIGPIRSFDDCLHSLLSHFLCHTVYPRLKSEVVYEPWGISCFLRSMKSCKYPMNESASSFFLQNKYPSRYDIQGHTELP